ncbi:hypothetical protein ACHAQH_009389 [Verticillium albo-atrum]
MPRPQLFTATELNRLQDRSDENDKLASCWDCEHVGILFFDYYVPPHSYTGYPTLRISLVGKSLTPQHFTGRTCEVRCQFTIIGNVVDSPPRHYRWDRSLTYEQPVAMMKAKVEEILADLSIEHATLCICSTRPKELAVGLRNIGVTIPKRFVVVDLVKVLEFQTVPDVIDGVLAGEGGFAARANDGEIWTGPGHGAGSLLASVLLAIVGPLAKNYTGDWKRIEREAVATSRLWEATGNNVVEEMKKMKRKPPR